MKFKNVISFIIFIVLAQNLKAQNLIYTSEYFLLNLNEFNNSFTFYSKESSLELTISGSSLIQNDSLILATHKVVDETAVFAIFSLQSNKLSVIFKQKEFYKNIPNEFFLLKKIHPNGSIAQENYWNNFVKGQYEKYEFDENKNILAKQNYNHFKLDGKQLIFLGDKESTPSFELNYKKGKLHGKSYFYKKLEDNIPKVELVKIEKYKMGILKRTKKPAKPPVFYTNHF